MTPLLELLWLLGGSGSSPGFADQSTKPPTTTSDQLLPRLVQARGSEDADDIASVIHHRLTRATTRRAGSGRTRKTPRLIAGPSHTLTGP